MSIEIRIVIPDDDINTPDALQKRLRLLGYERRDNPMLQAGLNLDAVRNQHAALHGNSDQAALPVDDEPTGVAEQHKAEAAAEQAARAKRGRPKKTEDKPNISATPEDRTPPADDAETAQQDEADEQAEVEASRANETPVTIDDLKAVVGDYVRKHSVAAAQEDGPKIFVSVLGNAPDGTDRWTFALLGELDAARLGKVVDAWKTAVAAGKRFGHG